MLKKYGDIFILPPPSSGKSYELKMKNPVGESVLIHGTPSEGVFAISINKPIDNDYLRPFIFDFLDSFDMILCDQNFLIVSSSKDLSILIPEQTLQEGVEIVKSENELFFLISTYIRPTKAGFLRHPAFVIG